MISKEEILHIANQKGTTAFMIEKDYVLGWILNAIGDHLKKYWVFKGGTCLKKCYFPDYRFSEDLDFTVLSSEYLDNKFIQEEFKKIIQTVYEKSGIQIDSKRTLFETVENPSGQTIVQGRIFYRGPISPSEHRQWPRIKFDLTHDEILIFNPISTPIFHQYSDASEFESLLIQSYGIEELFIEKTRALLERTRPRDLFDVVEIWKREEKVLRNVMSLNSRFRKKCAFKNVDIISLSSSKIEECRIGWKDQLEHQLSSLPNFENYFEFFRNTIFPVFENNSISE